MLTNHPTFHISKVKASSQRGGALLYILIAIALLAALTTTFIQPSGQSSRTQNTFKLATQLNSQARVIRSAIQDCILRYPEGDNGITETGYIDPYPLNPDSADTQYAAYDVTNKNVEQLRCPGANYLRLFGGGGQFTGFLPQAPNLMDPWTYFNGSATINGTAFNGIFFQIQSNKSDPFIGESMQKINSLVSSCEVDYTDATGGQADGCANGYQCLRFWIIRNSGGPAC
jgi:type II secretory pathway pseudopilin PulG